MFVARSADGEQLVGCQPSQGTPAADRAHFESIYLFIATDVYLVNAQTSKDLVHCSTTDGDQEVKYSYKA